MAKAACGAGRQTTTRARGLQDGPCGLPRRRGPQVHPGGLQAAADPALRLLLRRGDATHSRKHTRRLQEAPPWRRPRALSMANHPGCDGACRCTHIAERQRARSEVRVRSGGVERVRSDGVRPPDAFPGRVKGSCGACTRTRWKATKISCARAYHQGDASRSISRAMMMNPGSGAG